MINTTARPVPTDIKNLLFKSKDGAVDLAKLTQNDGTDALLALFNEGTSEAEGFDSLLQNLQADKNPDIDLLKAKKNPGKKQILPEQLIDTNFNPLLIKGETPVLTNGNEQVPQEVNPKLQKTLKLVENNRPTVSQAPVTLENLEATKKSMFMPKDKLLQRHKETFDVPTTPVVFNEEQISHEDLGLIHPAISVPKGQKIQSLNQQRGMNLYKMANADKSPIKVNNDQSIPANFTGTSEVLNIGNPAKQVNQFINHGEFEKNIGKLTSPEIEVPVNRLSSGEFSPQVGPYQFPVKTPTLNKEVSVAGEFNLDKLSGTNEGEVLNKISKHIQEIQWGNQRDIKFTVTSENLGKIEIQVTKKNNFDDIDVKIAVQNKEVQDFFKENKNELISKLGSSGITISEFKIENTQPSLSNRFEEKFSAKDHSNPDGNPEYNRNSEQNAQEDSQRRREIWEMYSNRTYV